MKDQRRLEVKTEGLDGGPVRNYLVFKGTDIAVGSQVYALHDRLAAVGYQVKAKTPKISEIAKANHPMYGVVRTVDDEGVVIEEMQTSPRDPVPGRMVRFERQFFLDHYEVD